MAYKDLDIQQAQATAETKLSLKAYSGYLQRLYGLRKHCGTTGVNSLLLLRFAISHWDNRPGAANAYDESGLTRIIRQINQI